MSDLRLVDESVVTVAQEQVSCDLAGEAAILNLKNGVYYGLDPVGARVWSLIQKPLTFSELRTKLLQEYEVETSSLDSDLRELLAGLHGHGLIQVTM